MCTYSNPQSLCSKFRHRNTMHLDFSSRPLNFYNLEVNYAGKKNRVIARDKLLFWSYILTWRRLKSIDHYTLKIFENSKRITQIFAKEIKNSLWRPDPLENRHFHFKTNQLIINSPLLSNKAPAVGIKILLRLNEHLSYVSLSFALFHWPFETWGLKL